MTSGPGTAVRATRRKRSDRDRASTSLSLRQCEARTSLLRSRDAAVERGLDGRVISDQNRYVFERAQSDTRDTRPTGPRTGIAHPKCYARTLEDCSRNIEGEHYFSKGMLRYLAGSSGQLQVAGIPTKNSPPRRLHLNSFVGNTPCSRHNLALSPIDASAIQAVEFIFSLGDYLEVGASRTVSISGHDLERWVLEALCGVLKEKWYGRRGVRARSHLLLPWTGDRSELSTVVGITYEARIRSADRDATASGISSALPLADAAPLFEKERHARRNALIANRPHPIGIHRSRSPATLAATEHPVNTRHRNTTNGSELWLGREKPHGRLHSAKNARALDIVRILHTELK